MCLLSIKVFLQQNLPEVVNERSGDWFLQQYQQLLQQQLKPLEKRGQVVIAIGTGRNGSTSFTQLLSGLPNSLVTHERPPLIYWRKQAEQLQFHCRFMALSCQYFDYVVDVSHWWLPHLHDVAQQFGRFKLLYLHREAQATIDSFIRLKSREGVSFNHWLDDNLGLWQADSWDACYPSFDLPQSFDSSNQQHKTAIMEYLVRRYVEQYHRDSEVAVEHYQGLKLSLAQLSQPSVITQAVITQVSQYLDAELGQQLAHLNQKGTQDSAHRLVFLTE